MITGLSDANKRSMVIAAEKWIQGPVLFAAPDRIGLLRLGDDAAPVNDDARPRPSKS
jgi:hypothetical protein